MKNSKEHRNMIHYITTEGVANATVVNELRAVGKAGIPFVLHTMRSPKSTFFLSPEIENLNKETKSIYPIAIPTFVGSICLAPFLFKGRFFKALWNGITGPRENLAIRAKVLWHLLVACVWVRTIRGEVSLIHSQWIHSCGSIGMYGAWLLGVPFSFTGHAADLFRDRAALIDKIRHASFIICISSFHRDFYLGLGAEREKLKIVYCGINTNHFKPKQIDSNTKTKFHVLSAGRLVEKKGFVYLIKAVKILLEKGLDIECTIAGSGELENHLNQTISELGLQKNVTVTGEPLLHENIPAFFQSGDCYCLPCVWASDNDVDGLPQMLMEAMSCEIPAISTRLVGIPDLIEDHKNGLLVEPNDVSSLADSIKMLHDNPDFARKMATEGRKTVEKNFNLETCLEPLLNKFRNVLNSKNDQHSS